MKTTKTLSNSFLVYSAVCLSILIYISGAFSVIHFVKESNQTGIVEALSENLISTFGGIICLFLTTPSYRLTKSLRILEVTDFEDSPAILILYLPLFKDDMP